MHDPSRNLKKFCLDPRYSTTTAVITSSPQKNKRRTCKTIKDLNIWTEDPPCFEGGLRTRGFFKRNHPGMPLVSIVTVVYNAGNDLAGAIESVIYQNYKNIEYIIIDGGSDTPTLNVIRDFDHAIDYWISQKDNGIYNAMNKGVSLAHGNLVGILNSDDRYENTAIKELVKYAQKNPDTSAFIGDIIKTDNQISNKKVVSARNFVRNPDITKPFNHPATFIRKPVYENLKGFDEKYKIAADCDFMYRLLGSGYNIIHLPRIMAYMSTGGASEYNFKGLIESIHIHMQHKKGFCKWIPPFKKALSAFPRYIIFTILSDQKLKSARNFWWRIRWKQPK